MPSNNVTNSVFQGLADVFTMSEQEEFFDILTQRLSVILCVEHVLIARVEEHGKTASVRSFFSNGQHSENINYPLAGTPCEKVSAREACVYPSKVAAAFPEDKMLVELGIESYLGFPIIDRKGNKLGLIAIMANTPIEDTELCREVLRITGAQIGSELQRRTNERRVQELAYTDPVTGAPNRTAFMQQIENEINKADANQEGLSLLVVNIRRFKEVNDTYSHGVGDALLAAVAERLREFLQEKDFVARFSSDEFGVLLPAVRPGLLPQAIENIKAAFHEPLLAGDRLFNVSVRIGAAHYPSDSTMPGSLLQRASIALNHARTVTTQSRIYDDSMSQELLNEQHMLERLKLALQEETLELYYQPQFDVRTGELCGAEALCRWNDAELGAVSPLQFIALAEDRGLIHLLGDWVVRTAVAQLKSWLRDYKTFQGTLSVNISARQFDDPFMANYLIDKVSELPRGIFAVELTESIMMRNPHQGMQQLKRLHDNGFIIAVDDFGTGYSSLSYLSQFPISVLKIDRSFIQYMQPGNHQHSIVVTILAMANALGLDTVAEGVETVEQERLLKDMGCYCMQGFLRGKPVPAEEFAKLWLSNA
ncbi:diguanylate cyclase (GGDEF) domain-containing protein [Idiomarina sp. A28L]|uniref:sensor domain-containing phosphodiesterase n=1 Tax=Idiomarina sp. A28L TaxID=1036674 RepID=UPI0002138A41|nr:GGDEF domain-containing protein [Idiomarina sp. A28L]EGN75031.1 diguanylate cyclase (GGDEF) domain-containing protein [Idiomarina sp. A28L]